MTREFYDPDVGSGSTYNTAVSDQVNSELVRPVYFIEADFDGSVERLCTHHSNIILSNGTYTGAGDCLSIGSVDEPYELRNAGVNISLSGLDSSILTHALTTDYQDKILTIRMGFFSTTTSDSPQLIGGSTLPPIIFVGRMDVMTITDTGAACNISLNVENRLADFERTNESRYTYEEQIERHANDYSLEHVVVIQKRVLPWGQ